MPIQLLDETVAAQIAAGEVVERPASVVKELLENALDAGARQISVEISEGGSREIRVRDDGSGIDAAEVELAFMRHATSKLRTADDLWNIHTLGFRGEALPSIASVSQLICVTRTAGAEAGTELRIAGGEVQLLQPIGAPRGTDIRVRRLFYNVPVRREYLRSAAAENASVAAIVQQYALAYPEVRFTLTIDGRTTLQTNGDGDLRAAVLACYGIEIARALLPVELESGYDEQRVRVSGLVAPPGLTRSSRAQMTLFANRRALQPRGALVGVIEHAYHTLLMKGRFPIVVLNLAVHPAGIDVNVHPTKSEVKFRYAAQVHSMLGRAIRNALAAATVPDSGEADAAVPDTTDTDPAAVQRQADLRNLGRPTSGIAGGR
jgi:DNA mismatch repair protein MutL